MVKFITHRSQRKYRACIAGATRSSWCWETGRTWGICLYQGLQVECFGIPWLRINQAIQTKNSEVLLNSMGVVSKGSTRRRSWEASPIRNLHLLATLGVVVYNTPCICRGGQCQFEDPTDHVATQNGCQGSNFHRVAQVNIQRLLIKCLSKSAEGHYLNLIKYVNINLQRTTL